MKTHAAKWQAKLAAAFQGFTPETTALIIAVGLTLGLFPVYGCPTVFCALASMILGLNLPAVQLVSQLVTPLQLALIVPFVRLGTWLGSGLGIWIVRLQRPAVTSGGLGTSALQAITGWLSVSVPLGVLLYFTLAYFLRRHGTFAGSGRANPGSHIPPSSVLPRLARGNA